MAIFCTQKGKGINIEHNKKYEVIELMGNKALFTSQRIDKKDIPIGFFKYELRHEDEDGMTPCEVSYQIMVNHYGTILTNKHIKMQHNGWAVFDGNEAFKFLDEHLTVKEYKEKYREQGMLKESNRHR